MKKACSESLDVEASVANGYGYFVLKTEGGLATQITYTPTPTKIGVVVYNSDASMDYACNIKQTLNEIFGEN